MRAKLGGMTAPFCVGDRVELLTVPPGRVGRLRVGMQGTVLVADD
jgi:hypothetical protein